MRSTFPPKGGRTAAVALLAAMVCAPAAFGQTPLATILFGPDTADLTGDATSMLDDALAETPPGPLAVVGYACYEVDPSHAAAVAQGRAESVAAYLDTRGRPAVSVESRAPRCGDPGAKGRVALVYAGTAAPVVASPAAAEREPVEKINIDFKDAEIRTVIRTLAELTGRNFVVDEKVKGNVTIISPKEVTLDEAMKVFESTLEVYGFSLVEAGDLFKVVPTLEARQKSTFRPGDPGDRLTTRLIPLKSVKAQELANTLRPLVPATSYMTAYQPSNTLIVADFASNINKIMRIVDQLDTPAHEESVTVIQLHYAGARELADKLGKIFGGEGSASRLTNRGAPPQPGQPNPGGDTGGMGQPQIIPDERINSLIVVAARPVTEQILQLVAQLDIPSPKGRGRINVYYLSNADAEEIAKVLSNIAGQAPQPSTPGQPPRAGVDLTDKVTVTPDKATNSLVITASVEDFETLKEVIQRLDIRRRQVFVEALIMEVSSTKSRQFGVEWRITDDFTEDGVQGFGGQDFGNINNVAQNPLAAPLGLAIGVVDGIISFGGKDFLNIGALAHALRSEADVNVLSTPNILTTDNQEAEIVVADEVPLEGETTVTTGGNTVRAIERKNVGLTLKLTPQISESDEMRLDVYQEISNIKNVQLEKAKDLITTKRSIRTSVVVKDGQNVVLGGLMQDDYQGNENKVPGFGDIPLLGWLFKSESVESRKTNLLVFLTPHIVRESAQIDAVTERQKRRMFEEDAAGGAEKAFRKFTEPPQGETPPVDEPPVDAGPSLPDVNPAPPMEEPITVNPVGAGE